MMSAQNILGYFPFTYLRMRVPKTQFEGGRHPLSSGTLWGVLQRTICEKVSLTKEDFWLNRRQLMKPSNFPPMIPLEQPPGGSDGF